MDIDKIVIVLPTVIEDIKKDYVLNNMIIKDDIFGILEKHCNVVYYPLENENNCGFHTKRYIKNELEDFVYINTAKTIAEQVFTAAHELGHVWEVATKVWEKLKEQDEVIEQDDLTEQMEELIINRFAAELLMPTHEFRKTFISHIEELKLEPNNLRLESLVRVIVMQMNDYMVPYESVRRRLIETDIISVEIGDVLDKHKKIITKLVTAFSKEQNTMLDGKTDKKTVPGLRSLVERVEKQKLLDEYSICKIKKDFAMEDINETDEIVEISIEDKGYGKN